MSEQAKPLQAAMLGNTELSFFSPDFALMILVRWENEYHTHICLLNMKLQPAAG